MFLNRLVLVVNNAALKELVGAFRFFEKSFQHSSAELVDGGARQQQGLGRVLALLPRLINTREGSIKLPVGDAPLCEEKKYLAHQPTHRDSGVPDGAEVGVGVKAGDGEVDGPERHPPIARPALHHLKEGAGIRAAIVRKLLDCRIMFRIQPLDAGLLEDLDALLQKLPHLTRPGGTLLLIQRSKAAEGSFHGCKQRDRP